MKRNITTKQHQVGIAVALALGLSTLPHTVAAQVVEFSWTGYLRWLDPAGVSLADTSVGPKGANQFETPISGTLNFETDSGAGTGTMQSFLFLSNPIPAQFYGMGFQAIGNGMGGPGSLVMANMLFDWGGNVGMPLSLVWDAAGFFNALSGILASGAPPGTVIDQSAVGAVRGAADGTYVGVSGTHITSGYLDLGVVPIATTKWNTTPTCTPGGGNSGACMNVNPSGSLPLVADTVTNTNDYNALFMGGDGSNDPGIGGSPQLAGPFQDFNFNIDITSLVLDQIIAVAPVPVPAAAWLLGSGLVGLIGVARSARRASAAGCA